MTVLSPNNKNAIDIIVPLGLGSLVFYKMYTSKSSMQEAGIFALVCACVAYVITSQLTKNAIEAAADHLSSTKAAEIQQANGATTTQVNEAKKRASSVYHAFWDGSYSEDEAAAIAAVNQCASAVEVRLMCEIYQSTYNKSLQADFDKFVNFWDGSINEIVTQNWT